MYIYLAGILCAHPVGLLKVVQAQGSLTVGRRDEGVVCESEIIIWKLRSSSTIFGDITDGITTLWLPPEQRTLSSTIFATQNHFLGWNFH